MLCFLFIENDLLLTEQNGIPEYPELEGALRLPAMDGRPCRALSLPPDAEVPEGLHRVGLRAAFDLLPHNIYIMAGKAAELLYWDKTTRFCGRCGAPMAMHTDISKRCTRCGSEVWPALQAAIIVAVTRRGGEEILLVQSKNFRGDYYGLVAGFVETGETLEECVAREVMEETGLRIRDLRYVASQPWPFPCGLMIGFEAETDDSDIVLQRSELNKGGWFTQQNLPAIPGKVSLARKLIDRWLEKQKRGL